MPSIDNHYLLLFLMHGQIAFACFLYILVGTMFRLLVYAVMIPPPPTSGGSLAFTLASINLGFMVAVATVYMGGQTIPMLFMLTAWANSYMQSGGRDRLASGSFAYAAAPAPPFRFRRVLY